MTYSEIGNYEKSIEYFSKLKKERTEKYISAQKNNEPCEKAEEDGFFYSVALVAIQEKILRERFNLKDWLKMSEKTPDELKTATYVAAVIQIVDDYPKRTYACWERHEWRGIGQNAIVTHWYPLPWYPSVDEVDEEYNKLINRDCEVAE